VVLVSILAAFAVDEFREKRSANELRVLALTNIRAEVEHNRSALDRVIPYHNGIVAAMGDLLSDPASWEGRPGFEVGAEVAPQGILPPALRHTAWETARATGAVALLDYGLSQRIAAAYDDKERGVDATVVGLVDHVFTLSTFRTEETEAVMMLMAGLAGELLAQETQLRETLDALLSDFPLLPEGASQAGGGRPVSEPE